MSRAIALLAVFLLCGSAAFAATSFSPKPETTEIVIRQPDGSIGTVQPIDPTEPFVRTSLVVEANIVGLARQPGNLQLTLSNGSALVVKVARFEPREGFSENDAGQIVVSDNPADVSYYWYGETGTVSVFVTVVRGNMSALFYGPDFRYVISDVGRGRHLYRELSARDIDAGRCATDEVTKRLDNGLATYKALDWSPSSNIAVAALPSAPSYFARATIMFYYTDASLLQFGNDVAALTTAADALIDQLNQSLTNTQDTYYFQFQRRGALQYLGTYAEQPTSPPITDPYARFTNHINAVRNRDIDVFQSPRRETEGADLAVLLVNDPGEPSAVPPAPVFGVAILQRLNCFGSFSCQIGAAGFRNYGHAVVSVNTMVANFTFSHEVGHMLGGQHDVNGQYTPSQGAYTYSYGYRVDGVARDIMAHPECITVASVTTCTTRQPQFANPNAFFIGTSTASGTSTQDVSRTIKVNAEGTGNIYPLTDAQSAPDIFWNGFE